MEFVGSSKDDAVKLPTFSQWLKSSNPVEHRPIRYVRTVWLPNKFKNITFETEVYRFRLAEYNPLYQEVLSILPTLEEEEKCIAIQVLDATEGTYKICVPDSETATWEQLGETGYRLTVNDKKRSKREPRKP